MKIMIGTPAYEGKLHIPYALSLANTMHLLQLHQIAIQPLITSSGSLLVAERNRIVQAFWESDCTHLLFIDADLGWPAQAVLAILESKKEFVAGCYPARNPLKTAKEFLFRPEYQNNGSLIQEKHLIKMQYIPAGFMLIARSVIKKMRDTHPDLYYEPKDKHNNPEPGYCFFNTEVYEGEFWGEDFVFCRKAREAGVDIWVDPLIQFDHAGTVGMLLDVLTANKAQEAA